jgi:integrase
VHRKDVDKLDAYTRHNHLIILKGWLKWCRKRRTIAINPLAEMENRQPRRRRHPAATIDQVNAVLGATSEWLFVVLIMLAFTGMRVGEAAALRPADVDLENGWVHVRRRADWGPKTEGSERSIPIHRRLLTVLSAMVKRKGAWFFNAPPSRQFPKGDHHVNPRDVNEQFQQLAAQCGFAVGRNAGGLTVHALRRFFKTFCLDSGVPKPMVDFWMGHRNQQDMDTFYYDPQKSKEWMERMPFGEPNDEELKKVPSTARADLSGL